MYGIFNKDDRVHDYQNYPKDAISSVLDLPDAGAQMSFASALIENVKSLADAGWNGGRYAPNWYADYRTARSWTTSGNLHLYADWDGQYLYVATEGVGSTCGWDHFVTLGVNCMSYLYLVASACVS